MTLRAYAPSGSPIKGTLDHLEACALVQEMRCNDDGSIEVEWAGESEIFWDSQCTQERDGEDLYLAEDGSECTAKEIVWKDDSEPTENDNDCN